METKASIRRQSGWGAINPIHCLAHAFARWKTLLGKASFQRKPGPARNPTIAGNTGFLEHARSAQNLEWRETVRHVSTARAFRPRYPAGNAYDIAAVRLERPYAVCAQQFYHNIIPFSRGFSAKSSQILMDGNLISGLIETPHYPLIFTSCFGDLTIK